MVRDRGLTTVHVAPDPIRAALADEPVVRAADASGAPVLVYVHTEDRVGIKWIRGVIADAALIVVSVDGPTVFARKECERMRVQFLIAREVYENVTRHAYFSKHERVDAPPEGVTVAQLPRILTTDRVVVYYDWPCGSIVSIARTWGGAEVVPYFRVVTAVQS